MDTDDLVGCLEANTNTDNGVRARSKSPWKHMIEVMMMMMSVMTMVLTTMTIMQNAVDGDDNDDDDHNDEEGDNTMSLCFDDNKDDVVDRDEEERGDRVMMMTKSYVEMIGSV